MNNSFLSQKELLNLGLKEVGNNVLISRKASIYCPEEISIGNYVRIDDFCILSGNISLGSYIHISAYCALYGKFGIEMNDYSGLSPRCTVFSATDDFLGNYLIGPMVSPDMTNVIGGKVKLEKFVQLGSGSIVLPSRTLSEGSVSGAMTLINQDFESWCIYVGIPARFLKKRIPINLIQNL